MNNLVIACVVGLLLSVAVSAVMAWNASDCWDLQTRGGFSASGPYTIHPVEGPATSVKVWCDMETDGGGWTVLQRRFDGSVDFHRNITEYEQGFGDVTGGGEYWLGLPWIHALTSLEGGEVELRMDLCSFPNLEIGYDGESGYAVYEGFNVSGQSDTYRLSVEPGTFRAGSLLDWPWTVIQNGATFQAAGVCTDRFNGGWWYRNSVHCFSVNLNGGRYRGGFKQGIVWNQFGSDTEYYPSLRSSDMKIRPVNATGAVHSPDYTCPT